MQGQLQEANGRQPAEKHTGALERAPSYLRKGGKTRRNLESGARDLANKLNLYNRFDTAPTSTPSLCTEQLASAPSACVPPPPPHSSLGLSPPPSPPAPLLHPRISSHLQLISWRESSWRSKPQVLMASAPDLSGVCRPGLPDGLLHI